MSNDKKHEDPAHASGHDVVTSAPRAEAKTPAPMPAQTSTPVAAAPKTETALPKSAPPKTHAKPTAKAAAKPAKGARPWKGGHYRAFQPWR